MDGATALFFDPAPQALPLYAALEQRILSAHPGVRVTVQKTQITLAARYGFCWVWLPQVRMPARREALLGVSFGLGERIVSPRILAAVEPYPNRWTHHLLLSGPEELDEELAAWLEAAYAFGNRPGRRRSP